MALWVSAHSSFVPLLLVQLKLRIVAGNTVEKIPFFSQESRRWGWVEEGAEGEREKENDLLPGILSKMLSVI